MMNTDMADEALMEVRSEIGERLVQMTGIDASQFNLLSTDTLVALMQAFEGIREESFNLGSWEGGRDAIALKDLEIEFEPNVTPWTDQADADAVVVDALTLQVQELFRRLAAIEMAAGLKYAPAES